MEYLSPKFLEAMEFAATAHKGQLRKFPVGIPYISHLHAVSMILAKSGYEEEVVIAGILHDIIEDTPFTADDIKLRFGDKVLSLVLAVTEQKSLQWVERKEKYLNQLKQSSEEAKAISAADLLSNRLSNLLGLRSGTNPWSSFSKNPAEYAKRIFEIDRRRMEVIKENTNIPFIKELELVAKEVEEITYKMLQQG